MLVTTSLWEFDKDRIWNTYELPAWAKVNVHYVRKREWEEPYEWECIATFKHMDWMYWLWVDDNWDSLIFNWKFKQISDDMFMLIDEDECQNVK